MDIFRLILLPKIVIHVFQVCDECENFAFEEMEFNFGFEVAPGMEAGQEFLYVGAGEVIPDGEPGDLRVS